MNKITRRERKRRRTTKSEGRRKRECGAAQRKSERKRRGIPEPIRIPAYVKVKTKQDKAMEETAGLWQGFMAIVMRGSKRGV